MLREDDLGVELPPSVAVVSWRRTTLGDCSGEELADRDRPEEEVERWGEYIDPREELGVGLLKEDQRSDL